MKRDDAGFRKMYPFESRFVQMGEHRLHYIDEGQGDPVLMLHGNPTWSFYYRRLASALRESHRAVVPDHMGCGFSDKPQKYEYRLATHIENLEHLVSTLNLHNITLVLHDWGGAIGMGYAVRHPERVKRVVVLNTAAFRSSLIPLRIRICGMPLLGEVLVRSLNLFARAALTMAMGDHARMTGEARQALVMPYDSWANRIAILRFIQDIPLSPGDKSYAVLKGIDEQLHLLRDKPMLIQWGRLDFCFNDTFLQEWISRFPDARIDVYDDAAHYVLEDAHERIIPRIREFLS